MYLEMLSWLLLLLKGAAMGPLHSPRGQDTVLLGALGPAHPAAYFPRNPFTAQP